MAHMTEWALKRHTGPGLGIVVISKCTGRKHWCDHLSPIVPVEDLMSYDDTVIKDFQVKFHGFL